MGPLWPKHLLTVARSTGGPATPKPLKLYHESLEFIFQALKKLSFHYSRLGLPVAARLPFLTTLGGISGELERGQLITSAHICRDVVAQHRGVQWVQLE